MNVMTNFTIRSLRKNRVRSVVTVAGVALAAALLTAVLTSFTSLMTYLYNAEAAVSGTWMAMAQVPDISDEELADLASDQTIDEVAVLSDTGFAKLNQRESDLMGMYMPILAASGSVQELCNVHAAEGRMPERAGEIIVSQTWQRLSGLELGDELTLEVGKRQAVQAPSPADEERASSTVSVGVDNVDNGEGEDTGESADEESMTVVSSTRFGYTNAGIELEEGSILDSSITYLDATQDGGSLNEELVDVEQRTYTVVGFYDSSSWAFYTSVGLAAVIADEQTPSFSHAVYVTMNGLDTSEAIGAKMEQLFPDDPVSLHTALLRYMGIRSSGAIWSTFFGLVATLAVVILGACVSLIYNAFAISVAERIRQFGLLSSIGASRRQLRSAVMTEAAIIACIGIPLGILIGVGGTALTFALLGPGLSSVLGNEGVPFVVVVQPWVLLLTIVLSAVAVFVSALVPAWRAGRVSPMEVLRQETAVLRSSSKGYETVPLVHRGLFGVGGRLAQITRKRSKAKGRAASVSLALAMVLLMTAGSLTTMLGLIVRGTSIQDIADVTVMAMFFDEETASSDGGQVIEPTEESETLASLSPDTIAQYKLEECTQLAEELKGVNEDTARMSQWGLCQGLAVTVDPRMAGTDMLASDAALTTDQGYTYSANIVFLEDEELKAYAQSNGINPDPILSAEQPAAIAVKTVIGNDGMNYLYKTMFQATGTVEVSTLAEVAQEMTSGGTVVKTDPVEVQIEALAEQAPIISGSTSDVILVLPLSALSKLPVALYTTTFRAAFDATDHEAAADQLSEIMTSFQEQNHLLPLQFVHVQDNLEEIENLRMMVTIINVFCLLFSLILTLIALANVFNTVTNSLILRRREFAVMRSIGMGQRDMRAMIASECVGYGLRGLIPGILLALVVSYLLFHMVTLSTLGLHYEVPWGYLLLAIGLAAACMVISVMYGMRRCQTNNLVEALRMN